MSYIKKTIVSYENSFIIKDNKKTSNHKAILKNVDLKGILTVDIDSIENELTKIEYFVNFDKVQELKTIIKTIKFSDSITNNDAAILQDKAINLFYELLNEFYTFRTVKNKKKKKRKLSDFDRLEKQLLCISNRIENNVNIVNYYKNNKIDVKTVSAYRCGLKNCLFCKRSKLLRNTLNHNIQKINNIDVNSKKLFITVSVDIDYNDIDIDKKALKFKQNLKSYFDNKDFKFFAMIEVANKLHCHIIFFDIQFYSYEIISTELRALFGYNYIEKLKSTETDEDNNKGVFDYVSKVFEYISKTYKSDNKSIDIQNYMTTDKDVFNCFYHLKNVNYDLMLNAFNTSINETNMLNFLTELKKDFLNKIEVVDYKTAVRFLLKNFISRYSFLISKIFENIDKNNKYLKDLKTLKSKETKNLFEFVDIQKQINDVSSEYIKYKNKVAYSVFKNFFLSKLKYFINLSNTLNTVFQYSTDYENKENENNINIFSSWFVTSKFKRIFFTNIKILEKKTNIIVNNDVVKFTKTKQTKKKIENINDNVIEFKKQNTLTISKNVKNDINTVANIFYKNSILKKNLALKIDDFGKTEIINLIEVITENKTRKSLNKYKSNHSENEYNARFEVIKKQTLKKIMGKIYAFYSNKKK